MPDSTPVLNLPFPLSSDPLDPQGDLEALAVAFDPPLGTLVTKVDQQTQDVETVTHKVLVTKANFQAGIVHLPNGTPTGYVVIPLYGFTRAPSAAMVQGYSLPQSTDPAYRPPFYKSHFGSLAKSQDWCVVSVWSWEGKIFRGKEIKFGYVTIGDDVGTYLT